MAKNLPKLIGHLTGKSFMKQLLKSLYSLFCQLSRLFKKRDFFLSIAFQKVCLFLQKNTLEESRKLAKNV